MSLNTFRMDHVMTPFVINCFYFCDPDGHSEYVRTKEALLVDERTPLIKSLCFKDIEAEKLPCGGCLHVWSSGTAD